jgi:hypothetical protein|tara:strand:+ start:131 stop:340 length:210 start_codon:yes stop_codon:yes gene_type:complete
MVVVEKVYVACDECSARGKRYSVEIPATRYDLDNIGEYLRKRLPKWNIKSRFGEIDTYCPKCIADGIME